MRLQPDLPGRGVDAAAGRKIRRTFTTRAAAKGWRRDALVAVRTGKLAEAKPKTSMRDACEAWLTDARAGVVRTRSGDPFKPSTLRAYETHLRLRVFPTLGASAFYRLRRADLQDLVDRQLAAGTAPATIGAMLGAIGAV